MKQIAVFIFLIIQLNILFAQENKSPQMVLFEVLSYIEETTDYSFIYNSQAVDIAQPTVLTQGSLERGNLFALLNRLFDKTDIAYTIVNKQIILTKKASLLPLHQAVHNKVTGIVFDENKQPIPGVNILIKGTPLGTSTNLKGEFMLQLTEGNSIDISLLGYQTETVKYAGGNSLSIVLKENAHSLDEIVITALGIEKGKRTLTYATQKIESRETSKIKEPNLMNALSGKVSGVQISRSASGVGGSVKVSIRGSRSVTGNNQPLYVINGVPIINSSYEQIATGLGGVADSGNRDGSDGISAINPDDIESLTILKGGSAAALYGSQASNGVVLIKLKQGEVNKTVINYNSTILVDQPISLPKLQNTYGFLENTNSSWGNRLSHSATDNVDDFFQNGFTSIQSVSVSGGSETLRSYLSYANTTANGIIEKNRLRKHNVSLHESASFFNGKLTIDGNINLIAQHVKNRPTPGGLYMNPLVGLYGFPRGMDITPYKDDFELYSKDRNMPIQNWYTNISEYQQNPYWLTNRIQSVEKRMRALTSISANLKIAPWLSIQMRGTNDHINDSFKQKIYASTSPSLAGENGRYIDFCSTENLIYGDVLALINKRSGNWELNFGLGSSIWDHKISSLRLDSKTASLYYPNVFTIANINFSSNAYIEEKNNERRQIQSIFGTAQIGYNNQLFLDLTARNDWSSTLAYTKNATKGFFYPSIGTSWIINHSFDLPSWISLAKLRTSWSHVGNDLPIYVSNPTSEIIAGGGIITNDKAPFDELEAERNKSIELGTAWNLFENRFYIDATYYKTNTENQLFTLPAPTGSAYKYYYVNAGDIQNQGCEITIGGVPVFNDHFKWSSELNYTTNNNQVKALHPDLPIFIYGDEGFSSTYSMRLVEGGSFGDIYGKAFKRDENGAILYNDEGLPLTTGSGNTAKVGNCNPDFMLGWNNRLKYKNITLSFLIDVRYGGEILSQTEAILDELGVSERSGVARDNYGLMLEGKRLDKVKDFYQHVSGRSGVTEYYMFDATNVRLRELSIGYRLPEKWMKQSGVFKQVQFSLIARNLFFFYKAAPFDPDMILSTGNDNQGIDVFGIPTTRSMGFSVQTTI
jgi:TonB-linked SusC/RagA family outer membrane protein